MPCRVLESPRDLKEWVGKEVGVSGWIELSQDRIGRFADATDDHQWIHLDVERAGRESPYRNTIAHGFLTLSFLSSLMRETVTIGGARMTVNYGVNRVRFPSPVPAGSKIRARFTLQSLRELGGAWEAVWSGLVEREGGDKPCCAAEWVLRYYE